MCNRPNCQSQSTLFFRLYPHASNNRIDIILKYIFPLHVYIDYTLEMFYGVRLQTNIYTFLIVIDPAEPGRIGGHYFHSWCPYVRYKKKPQV